MKGKKGYRSGAAYKTYYKLYKMGKWEENANRRLKRHIKHQPDDVVAIEALKRLDKNKKRYVRDRKSNGHICKAHPDLVTSIAEGDNRFTVIQQMENIGFKYRGRAHRRTKNKSATRQSMARVR